MRNPVAIAFALTMAACGSSPPAAAPSHGELRPVTPHRSPEVAAHEEGCDQASYPDCTALALALMSGEGIEEDRWKGFALLETTCDHGWGEACFERGSWYAENVESDEAYLGEAVTAFGKACDHDFAAGCNNLAAILGDDGDDTNDERAFALYSKACDLKLALGCENAASLLDAYEGSAPAEIEALYRRACELDDESEACTRTPTPEPTPPE